MAMTRASATLDKQINDYLLTASGHLKDSKPLVGGQQMAAFGVAASSALAMMSQAEAAVVMNGGDAPPISVINAVGTGTFWGAGYRQFDMDGDGNNDFAIWGYSGGNNGLAVAYGTYESSNAAFGGGSDDLPKLSAGFTLGPAIPSGSWTGSVMSTGNDIVGNGLNNPWGSGWTGGAGEFGFVGVRFENAGGTHYGWICLRSDPTPGAAEISVIAYAYENTPDAAIQAGDRGDGVPVACSAALAPVAATPTPVPVMAPLAYGLTSLALGGLGLAGLRRRREALKAEQTRH
ncbi:MAG: hypothetical protein QG662_1499 [Pseudomonadota bacterium]|nr:hypothetical protein [Pseudomonadota bacterium]